MGDKRPLVAALLLIVIGVAAALVFRKPSDTTLADSTDAGESVLRRHEPVGLAAGARPLAMPASEPSTSSVDAATAPESSPVGLVGRINPVSEDSGDDKSVSARHSMAAVPPVDTGSVQRLPSVTSPPPDYLMQPSALSRQYPSTSDGAEASTRRPAAATSVDAVWPGDESPGRASAAAVSDEATDVPRIRLHRVRDGDSLFTLAERFLGDSGRYLEIYEANRDVLRSPEQLPIGSQLRIPRGGQRLTPNGTARRPGGSSSHTLPHEPHRLVPVTPRRP